MIAAEGQQGEKDIDQHTAEEHQQGADDHRVERGAEEFFQFRGWQHGEVDAVAGEVPGAVEARGCGATRQNRYQHYHNHADFRRDGETYGENHPEQPYRHGQQGEDEHGAAIEGPQVAEVFLDNFAETVPVESVVHGSFF